MKKRLVTAAPMNSLHNIHGIFGQVLQQRLFPILEEELGPLNTRYAAFISALALLQMDGFVAVRHGRGRPAHDRACIARAFLAKAVFNLPHTRALLDRLTHDVTLRRLCGWESAAQVPDESVFSRAFAELASQEFGQRVHAALIERTQSERLVGHVIRDSTAIPAREKPQPKPQQETPKVRRRHAGGYHQATGTNDQDRKAVLREYDPGRDGQRITPRLQRWLQAERSRTQRILERLQVAYGCNRREYSDWLRVDVGFGQRQPGGDPAGNNERTTGHQLL